MGLYWLVLGIICRMLGVDHFTTITDICRSIPGLTILGPVRPDA